MISYDAGVGSASRFESLELALGLDFEGGLVESAVADVVDV